MGLADILVVGGYMHVSSYSVGSQPTVISLDSTYRLDRKCHIMRIQQNTSILSTNIPFPHIICNLPSM